MTINGRQSAAVIETSRLFGTSDEYRVGVLLL